MADSRLRAIKVKTGALERLIKENAMYIVELENEKRKLQKYVDEGRDIYEIRKQEEIIHESKMVIPQTQKLLLAAFHNLRDSIENSIDLKEDKDYKKAQTILNQFPKNLEDPYYVLLR